MRRLAFVLIAFLGTTAVAAETAETVDDPLFVDGTSATLDEYLWVKRPIVVFADNPNDPRFQQQVALLEKGPDQLETRDVVVLLDSDPSADSTLREALRPRGFMMVLIGKDGTVYLRKPSPWNVREITRSIDKLPLRQQEERDRRADPIR
ncbi:protein of unknown function [Shimia gijangensis]|uniref:DUF4174 domain-containing protein n=1 Tax=Shimia gijangensis TaxID=1470563 RepID=A0A1M6NYW8_9RHOB|nr:DUF4174 domain-containing protein [Shimia gijangensis]SHK00883.1 protein of unknown function [Shimia gijangensis]